MAFTIASAPHGHSQQKTATMMRWVLAALLPGIATQCYFFGYGVLVQLLLGLLTAAASEALVLALRHRPIGRHLQDSSALLTGALLAVALPPLAPWWLVIIGTVFAIIVAKQLYGGLGQNPFNPAMVAYVLLLVSFPSQMTSWQPAHGLAIAQPDLLQALQAILHSEADHWRHTIDGVTSATPLDSMKTQLGMGRDIATIQAQAPFGDLAGIGWGWVNLAFLAGGLFLILIGTIAWQIPTAMLLSLTLCAAIAHGLHPEQFMAPQLQLLSGATMLGAFFIATDPVTAATTPRGRLLFGALIGILIFVIRSLGGYPDGVAFAVLLANICTPLIDNITRPAVYGSQRRAGGK
ncbi:electron transport complex subunit RsxD [Pseudaeromonas sharmana]|uniref:Ion-translocating oxidoreductase complex subunit D n=1 Tax=Pseudaeromonas sharmana TaxID=328412 RepID=A0ABV8CQE3_9GAMM